MQIPQIRIESQVSRIGLTINKPNQSIEQPQADLSIEQPPAEMEINRLPSKLTIDQTLAKENLDLKSIFKRGDENSQLGYQAFMDYVSKTVQEGAELMRIENGGNPIANQAERALDHDIVFNTGNTPSQNSVKVEYTPSKVEIEWKRNKPNIQVQINRPIHEYTPGRVDVHIEQTPSLKIDFKL
ncbi:hypothetical protein F7731_10575 [Cytobacillus depressus]|uniref:YviE n=1 Tax=Cytobacillus depressus TaxID=1602942 RepID=A0A6L3V862_9BACI|nr:DUF6470 family protein [Cytobacillus depressus]KAB2336787.1 hypothetical protein F7731_10575 [Cytobacillus depressus]